MLRSWAVALPVNIVFSVLLYLWTKGPQLPFRKDAETRDELAPADLMFPFLAGVAALLCTILLPPIAEAVMHLSF